jgi:Flp pilus assembly protein TadG
MKRGWIGMPRGRRGRKGSAMLEFVLLGVPSLFLTLSVFEVSLTMWQYHTLAEAAATGARYAVTHGSDCSQNGNSCATTAAQVATVIKTAVVGLDPAKVNVTLTPQTGSAIGPYTVSNCSAGNAQATGCTNNFPPTGATGAPPNTITVNLTYTAANPFAMFWPGAGKGTVQKAVTIGAISTQEIMF